MTRGEFVVIALLLFVSIILVWVAYGVLPEPTCELPPHTHGMPEHEHEITTKFYTEFPHFHMIEFDHTGKEILDNDRIDPRVQVEQK